MVIGCRNVKGMQSYWSTELRSANVIGKEKVANEVPDVNAQTAKLAVWRSVLGNRTQIRDALVDSWQQPSALFLQLFLQTSALTHILVCGRHSIKSSCIVEKSCNNKHLLMGSCNRGRAETIINISLPQSLLIINWYNTLKSTLLNTSFLIATVTIGVVDYR